MNVKSKIESIINHDSFLHYLLMLTLSTILIGYAPSSIALVVFCLFAIRNAIINKITFKPNLFLLLSCILYILCCVSYFWTVDQALTIKGIGRLSVFLLVPIVFTTIPKLTFKSFQVILNGFTVSNILLGIFFLIVAVVNYIKFNNSSVFTYHDFVEILDLNAIYVSVFYSLSYFFILSKKIKKRIDYIGLLLLLIFILLLSSKTIIATFLLGNILYFVFYKKRSTLKSPKAIGIVLVSIVIITFTSREVVKRVLVETTTNFEEVLNREKFNKIYPWTGTSIRLLQLRNLKEQIEENNVFWKGFGLFASRENLRERHLAFNTYHGYYGYNYHNMYAQILAELGIFGLLTLLVILGTGLKKSFKAKSFFMLMFYFLMIMTFFTESFLWVHRGVFLFVIMSCIFYRTDFQKNKIRAKE
ncbi:O-antigen ligase family protein [Psychroserpens sp. S379A]|uniref:O-antigen ligase family protein n=1 Tax=Psychroserpens sp. S379A TaxID=3415137 RepID=UPI003C7E70CA